MRPSIFDRPSPLSIWRMIFLILNYCLGYLFLYPIIAGFFLFILGFHSSKYLMYLVYGFTLITTLYLAKPLCIESYQVWKRDKTHILIANMKFMIGVFFVSTILSDVISQFTDTLTSNNQSAVSDSIVQFPLFMALAAMLFAPIVEEILFRGVFYRPFRTRFGVIKATLISSCAFGFLHVYDSIATGQWQDCWYFFVYAAIGFFLCRSYEETETLFGPILLHFLNNGLAFLFIFL